MNELLALPLGSWDDPTWSKARSILHELSSCNGDWRNNVKSQLSSEATRAAAQSLSLLKRMSKERPNSTEASDLMNLVISINERNFGESIAGELFVLNSAIQSSMEECVLAGWRPNMETFQMLLRRACCQMSARENAPLQAEKWLSVMWKHSQDNPLVQPDRYTYSDIIQAWSRSNDMQAPTRIEVLVRQLQKLYHSPPCDQNNGDNSNNNMCNERFKPTEAAYVGWIVALSNINLNSPANDGADRAEKVLWEILERAEEDQFWPSRVVYNAAIHAWARRGNAPRAEALLRHMCQSYIEGTNQYCMPDTKTFSTVITAWAKSGAADAPIKAENLMKLMQEFHIQTNLDIVKPNVVSLASVLNCWAKSDFPHGPERAEAILRHMQQRYHSGNGELKPNVIVFNTCLNAWSRSGAPNAPERVEKLFREMQDQYIQGDNTMKADGVSFMTRINVWERSGRRNAAYKAHSVLEEMIALGDPEVFPTCVHWNRVIRSWSQRGEASRAHALLQRMLHDEYLKRGRKNCAPNVSTFNFVLAAYSKSGLEKAPIRAERLLNYMQNLTETTDLVVKPDLVSFNTVLGCWAKASSSSPSPLRRANIIFSRMQDAGIAPDVVSFGALFKVLATSKGISVPEKEVQTRSLLDQMEHAGLKPNEYIRQWLRFPPPPLPIE